MTHRHPGRLHRPAGRAVPAADGAAQRRRLADQLAGAVRPDLRVPRPAGRGRRPGRPGRRRPGPGARARALRGRHLRATRAATPRAVAGVNLDVPAGTTLALVGETGSGKSTLAALVARLHDPDAGRITIDGVDLRDLRLADLAAIVGVVSQETYLLHTTVRENLRYARPDATDAEIEAAARAAQIHDLIAGLPDGLRHDGRLPRPPLLRRREAAHRDRPHAAARPARAGPRRGDQRAGHRDRARRAAGVRRARPRAAPRSPSRTGSPPCATPTRSRCSTTAGSSSPAPTTSLLDRDGRYAALAA